MTNEDKRQREVIAHFALPPIMFSAVIWIFLLWFFFLELNTISDPALVSKARISAVTAVIFLPIFLIFWAPAIMRLGWTAWANRGEALWIAEGQLIHPYKNIAVPLSEISNVEVATQSLRSYTGFFGGNYASGIVLHLKNGGKKVLPAQFSELAEDIVAALKDKATQARLP